MSFPLFNTPIFDLIRATSRGDWSLRPVDILTSAEGNQSYQSDRQAIKTDPTWVPEDNG